MNGWFAVLFAKAQWGVPDDVFWQLPIATKLSTAMDAHRFKAIWQAMDPMRATWKKTTKANLGDLKVLFHSVSRSV
jgi:hypothetical protein